MRSSNRHRRPVACGFSFLRLDSWVATGGPCARQLKISRAVGWPFRPALGRVSAATDLMAVATRAGPTDRRSDGLGVAIPSRCPHRRRPVRRPPAGDGPQGAPTNPGRYRWRSLSPFKTPTPRTPTRQPRPRLSRPRPTSLPFTQIGLPDARRARSPRLNRMERVSASAAGARSRARASGVTAEAADPLVKRHAAGRGSACLPGGVEGCWREQAEQAAQRPRGWAARSRLPTTSRPRVRESSTSCEAAARPHPGRPRRSHMTPSWADTVPTAVPNIFRS
jgi:hypothetical protein